MTQVTRRFLIEHTCSRSVTFEHAKHAFEKAKKASAMRVDVGPMSESEPNLLRIHVLGAQVIVGVSFYDSMTLVMISSPASLEWAAGLARTHVEGLVTDLLEKAGSQYVRIEEQSAP